MKEIIQKGHKFMKVTCPNCKCIFKFEEEDIEEKLKMYDNQGIAWATTWALTCPDCKRPIKVIDTKDVTKL